jgi:hypothetical protein
MSRRGTAQLEAITAAIDAFGPDADQLVVIGSCALALYARAVAPSEIRSTKDIDCVCIITPFTLLQTKLSHLCESGILSPDQEILCRYRIRNTGTIIDIIDLEGRTTGKDDPWVRRAAGTAQRFLVRDGVWVRAVRPPVFLAMKLSALADRGPDEMSADAEDIVTLAVEVNSLVDQVQEAGLAEEVASLFDNVRTKYRLSSITDLADYHIHPSEVAHLERVRSALMALAKERR